jgi:hypothetical protein
MRNIRALAGLMTLGFAATAGAQAGNLQGIACRSSWKREP